MLRIGSIVWNVTDLGRAAGFWTAALGYQAAPGNTAFLVPNAGHEGPRLHLDEEDRTHVDLWVDGEEEQRREVERLIALGARRVEWTYPDNADFVVLADPDGNHFCVVDAGN